MPELIYGLAGFRADLALSPQDSARAACSGRGARIAAPVHHGEPITEAARISGLALPNASRDLASLEKQGWVVRIRRGLWAVPGHPDFSPYVVVPYLAGGDEEGYVSLLSALNLHGMIEQIPGRIQAVTRRWRATQATPVGTFEFHQVSGDLFGGYEPYGTAGRFVVATPEKALFDLLYLSAQRGKRFARLPEVELPRRFRRSEIGRWARELSSPAYRAAVVDRAATLMRSMKPSNRRHAPAQNSPARR